MAVEERRLGTGLGKEDGMTTAYHVSGMSCDGCVRAVTNAIQGVDPGATVEIDLASGKVVVDSHLDDSGIADAVNGAGFTFDGRSA
jgi:copper chaperone